MMRIWKKKAPQPALFSVGSGTASDTPADDRPVDLRALEQELMAASGTRTFDLDALSNRIAGIYRTAAQERRGIAWAAGEREKAYAAAGFKRPNVYNQLIRPICHSAAERFRDMLHRRR